MADGLDANYRMISNVEYRYSIMRIAKFKYFLGLEYNAIYLIINFSRLH